MDQLYAAVFGLFAKFGWSEVTLIVMLCLGALFRFAGAVDDAIPDKYDKGFWHKKVILVPVLGDFIIWLSKRKK